MHILSSILILFGVIGGFFWWSNTHTLSIITETDTISSTGVNADNTNSIITPIQEAEQLKLLVESKNLFLIDVSNQKLSKVPIEIFKNTDIQSLNLSNNELSDSLPAEIRHLKSLRNLDLSNNKFTGLPAEIGQLQDLEVLNLSNNLLTGLPYELGNLTHLKTLNLKGNTYSEYDLTIIKEKLSKDVVIITN